MELQGLIWGIIAGVGGLVARYFKDQKKALELAESAGINFNYRDFFKHEKFTLIGSGIFLLWCVLRYTLPLSDEAARDKIMVMFYDYMQAHTILFFGLAGYLGEDISAYFFPTALDHLKKMIARKNNKN